MMVAVDDPIGYLARFGNEAGALPHSVILDARGEIVDTHTGPLSKEQLEAFLKPHL